MPPTKNHAKPGLISSVAQLLHNWWRHDRIRVSKSCGQLLTLVAGNRLLIRDELFIIARRTTNELSSSAPPSHVVYLVRSYCEGLGSESDILDENLLFSADDQTIVNEATLVVPVTLQDAIWFIRSEIGHELLAEEITVLSDGLKS